MAFVEETVTPGVGEEGHVLMSKVVYDCLVNAHVVGVAVNAGGSGYTVGDEVTISGGTAVFAARAVVTSVAAGVVDGVRVRSAGVYTTLPDSSAAAATTGGTGSGLTLDLTVDASYSATPSAGGSGYAVGDVVTPSGGTLFAGSAAPTFVVTAVAAGAVTALAPLAVGHYTILPTNPAATTTGGAGTGLTVDLAAVGWVPDRIDYVDGATDFQWIAHGANPAGADPYGGVRTFTQSGNPSWAVWAFTGFNSGSTFEAQPGAFPGVDVTLGTPNVGPRVPLTIGSMRLFCYLNRRRVIAVMRDAPTYEQLYLGLFNPIIDEPATKYPLPHLCHGTTTSASQTISTAYSNTISPHAALPQHGVSSGFFRRLDGAWSRIDAPGVSGSSNDNFFWPTYIALDFPTPDSPDPAGGTHPITAPFGIINDAAFGDSTQNDELAPLPFGAVGGKTFLALPCPLIANESVSQPIGELDGLFVVPGREIAAEDRLVLPDGRRLTVFPNVNGNEFWQFYGVAEE